VAYLNVLKGRLEMEQKKGPVGSSPYLEAEADLSMNGYILMFWKNKISTTVKELSSKIMSDHREGSGHRIMGIHGPLNTPLRPWQ